MDNTWIKLYRKLKEHPVFQDDKAFRVFMWVLLSVDKDGNMTTGRYKASGELGIDPNTFRKILHDRLSKRWELVNLSASPDGKWTAIRVTNWHKYQSHYAEQELAAQSYTQLGNTSDEKLPAILVTQDNEAKSDVLVTQGVNSVTPLVTQAVTQSGNTKNSLNNEGMVTQSVTENGNTPGNTVIRINKDNKNIYIKQKKKSEPDTLQDSLLHEFLDYYNLTQGTKFTDIHSLRANFKYWSDIYPFDSMKKAIDNVAQDKFWHDKMTPVKLLRRKDTNHEDVDRIGELCNNRTATTPTPNKPRTNFTEERLAEEAQRKDFAYGQTAPAI